MLNKRSMQGLKVVSHIASAPLHAPATADQIAKKLEFSVSYVEGLLKDAKAAHLIRSIRGPGGGYQLNVPLSKLSVWDAASSFSWPTAAPQKSHSSPETSAANAIAQKACQLEKEFLQSYPFANLVPENAELPASKSTKSLARNFKPLPARKIPVAPNSIFDFSNFLKLKTS